VARLIRPSPIFEPRSVVVAAAILAASGARVGSADGAPPASARAWTALWTAVPRAAPTEYGVYHSSAGRASTRTDRSST